MATGLRRIWHLPARCHTAIIHSVAGLQSIFNIVCSWSIALFRAVKACPSNTVHCVFYESKNLVFTTTGFNATFGVRFLKVYSVSDFDRANIVCHIHVCNLPNQEDTIAVLCL